jgi:hypothetical protein
MRLWKLVFRSLAHAITESGGHFTEKAVTSDFAAARVHLQRAFDYLRGSDETSRTACEALDVLINAVATAEYSSQDTVVPFPRFVERR